ncbi:Histone-lysine N-methyltransferase SETD1B-A [Bagarius yarrelli]|uniref:Histone-lysine N-methyltransferase SETD1B-A n=1 Tax=Bagarius yarrelli TaxID=175774 RepID=A0A556UFR4_BAGYA|nr:Histone-lysine N-methyltransferase SETD1B-A [Bagarius yarrelli]
MMSESGEKEGYGDNECVAPETEKTPNWSSYKLIVDPVLESGKEKIYRYDGLHFSAPIDENYVGPPKEVTFARLNDNIKAGFLMDMCRKFGEIQEAEVLYNPKNKKHLGIAKVIFETARGANDAVQKLHSTSVMGNRIHVELDPKGEKRMQYFQLLVSGLYTPFTLPLGEEAWGPQSPTNSSDSHNEYDTVKHLSHGLLSSSSSVFGSSSFDCSTPMSMDTAYSSMHQDTPCSFWQDTPHGSPTSHSNPGTPPRSEGLVNPTDTQSETQFYKNHTQSTPLNTSESQHTCHNPYLVQLMPQTPNTGQRSSISLIQSSWTSKGHIVSGGQSRKCRAPQGGHKDRVWGTKYQNAYNRRPEHRYIHRPGFNRSHYRSGCTTNLVPLVTFQGTAKPQPNGSLIHCSSSTKKPSGQTLIETRTGSMDKQAVMPVSQRGNLCQIQTLCSQPLGKSLVVPQTTISNCFNSSPHVPFVQQQDTNVIQAPELCIPPATKRSPSTEQEPSSLDSRIKMLLGTQSLDSGENEETLNSEDLVSPNIPQVLSKSGPYSPQSPDASPTVNFSTASGPCSSTQQTAVKISFKDVNSFQISVSANKEEETQPSNKPLSKIPVISTTQPAQEPHLAAMNMLSLRPEPSEQHSQPGTGLSTASSVFPCPPPPPVLLPPAGFPTVPPPVLPPMCGTSCPALPPVPVRIAYPPPNFSVSPLPLSLPPKIPMGQINRPPRWTNPPPSACLPIPTRITQGKSHTVFPSPFSIPPPLTPFTCVDEIRQAPCPGFNSAAVPVYRAPWPPTQLPAFDPLVPPPGYLPMTGSLHKATVDGVIVAVAAELRVIVKKDIYRRMIESVAFAAFDQWWDERENSAKISVVSVKSGERKEKEIVPLRVLEPCQTAEGTGSGSTIPGTGLGLGLRSILKLPSFKVKRKDPSGEDPGETKKSCPSSSSGQTLLFQEAGQETHMQDEEADKPQKEQGVSAVKRRHARPLELDSDDEEEQDEKQTEENEEEDSGNKEKFGLEQEECRNTNIANTDQEEDDEEEGEGGGEEGKCLFVKVDETFIDKEVISIASSDSSINADYESTLSSRSDTRSSNDSRYSSDREESDGDDVESPSSEAPEEERAVEEIWISSDDDDGDDVEEYVSHTPASSSANFWGDELELPLTPSAPLSNDGDPDDNLLASDGQQELRVQVFLHSYGCQDPVSQHLSNKLELSDPATLPSAYESPELQCPPSPTFRQFSSDEGLETDMIDLLEESATLRPPTPTGSQTDSEPELELRMSPTAADEVELPCTPGGSETEPETLPLSPTPSPCLPPPPSPTGFHLFPSPPLYLSSPPLFSSYPAYDETPKTPGRTNREEQIRHTAEITMQRMAMHSPFPSSFLSVSPHTGSGVPRTPGRDITPSSPLSEESEVLFQQREHWRSQSPRYSQQIHIRSTSSSPYSSDSSSSGTQDLRFSTNQLAHFNDLRRRRERMQRKRRMILLQGNKRNKDNYQHVSLQGSVAKSSSCVAASYLSKELAADAKKPLQGLENRLENRLQQRPLGNQRLPEPLYPWRKRKSCLHSFVFAPRSKRRERLLINAVWTKGVNSEEIGHLKASYERMLLQSNTFDWLRSTHWVPHPHILT